METDIVIIGGGPVGIFAAFQAGIIGMKTHIIDSLSELGGQCTALYPEKNIYDIPGYVKITAAELIENLKCQAEKFNPIYHTNSTVLQIEKEAKLFVVKTDQNTKITCKAIIIAAGSGAFDYNRLPINSAPHFEGKTLFYSVQNKNIFYDKIVAIAGGGDSAADWAVALSEIVKKIYLIHRRQKFRCMESTMARIEKLKLQNKIEVIVPYQVKDIIGVNSQIEHVILTQLNGDEKVLKADYLLAFFGLKTYLKNIENWGLNIVNHHIEVSAINYQTNIEHIYAIGDIATYPEKLKLILCGFAEAATVCHHIHKTIFGDRVYNFQYSTNMEDIFK